jgi:hypothetical protein
MAVTIEVTNSGGRTCEVNIQWGNTHSCGLTDRQGRVTFDVSPGTGTVYVDGKKVLENSRIAGTVRVCK